MVARKNVVGLVERVVTFEPHRRPDLACPFNHPRLAAANPAEVAWAAEQLAADRKGQPVEVEALVAALRAMRAGTTEEHQRAVLHLLHAAVARDVVLPIAELRFEPEGRTRLPWFALQTRAVTKNGREVFELFHALDTTTDPGWEVLGDSLAIRNHLAFALELRTHMVPRLLVFAGNPASRQTDSADRAPMPQPIEGFPWPPNYSWQRDRTGLLGVSSTFERRINDDLAYHVDARQADRTRLRWLAELVGEASPVAWAMRFEAPYKGREMGRWAAFAQAAEVRASESLERADTALRRLFRVSQGLKFPALEVRWEDGRSAADQQAMPMPVRKR